MSLNNDYQAFTVINILQQLVVVEILLQSFLGSSGFCVKFIQDVIVYDDKPVVFPFSKFFSLFLKLVTLFFLIVFTIPQKLLKFLLSLVVE